MKINFTYFKEEFSSLQQELLKSFKKVGMKGEYILGTDLKKFENNAKNFLNVKYAVGVGNWTVGIGLVFKALNLKKNDEIITVSNSFVATCGAISYYGHKPILIDVGKDLNIDCNLIQRKINKRTKAIMPVHLSGLPADIDKIRKICKKNKIYFIEDAAHAFGTKYRNKYIGGYGDLAVFSLHPRKNFHVFGDGGLITTNNKKIYEKILLLRNHGLQDRDNSIIWGTNSRLDNIQASFGNIIIKKINKWNKRHLNIAEYYSDQLKNLVEVPHYDRKISIPTFHQFIIRTKYRDELKRFLYNKGISTAIHYPKPIHKQKAYINSYGNLKLPKTEKYSKQILSLPIHNLLKDSEVKYIVKMIKDFFSKK